MIIYLTEDNVEIDNRDSGETWLHYTDPDLEEVTILSFPTGLVIRMFESIVDNLPPDVKLGE